MKQFGEKLARGQLEQLWATPPPEVLSAVPSSEEFGWSKDPEDFPVLKAALAARASYLLSQDQEAFRHGEGFGRLEFWHPDTFLTALFESDPEMYIDVRLDLADVEEAFDPFPPLLPSRRSG